MAEAVVRRFCNIHRKTPVLEPLFNKVVGLECCKVLKGDSNAGVFM